MINKGVLPDFELNELISGGIISGNFKIAENQVQPSSLDLRIGEIGYRIRSSFLPQGSTVKDKLADLQMYSFSLTEGGILEKGNVYLIPLIETLNLPSNMSARANPKSSTGRLDIFTRVITDRSFRFEDIQSGYSGPLFLEIVPKSFTILIKTGQSLNQLRLFKNTLSSSRFNNHEEMNISDSKIYDYYGKTPLLYDANNQPIPIEKINIKQGLFMSINIEGNKDNIIGYKAKKNSAIIDLEKIDHYSVIDYWEPIYSPKEKYIILEPEEFYIFASKEKVRVPTDLAGEMVEFDAGSGELRTHYAGFFDSGFGYGKKGEIFGTKAVLEVRPHDVPFRVEDAQVFCKIKYEPMLNEPKSYYGSEIGSHYFNQALKLSKHFKI